MALAFECDAAPSYLFMKEVVVLVAHLVARLAMLLGPRGTRTVLAAFMMLKQQLLVLQWSRCRAPNLRTTDRRCFGFWALFLGRGRLPARRHYSTCTR